MFLPLDYIPLIFEYLMPTEATIFKYINNTDNKINVPYNLSLVNKQFMNIANNLEVWKSVSEHFAEMPTDFYDDAKENKYFNHKTLYINDFIQKDHEVFKQNSGYNKLGFLHHCNKVAQCESNYMD